MRRVHVVEELILLAGEPSGCTATSPVLSEERTPLLFDQMRMRLFVGFAHNLSLESMVSRLAMLEKRHPKTHALTLDNVFRYHMNNGEARAERHKFGIRSSTGGALREKAKDRAEDHKPISGGANRSKLQQQVGVGIVLGGGCGVGSGDAVCVCVCGRR